MCNVGAAPFLEEGAINNLHLDLPLILQHRLNTPARCPRCSLLSLQALQMKLFPLPVAFIGLPWEKLGVLILLACCVLTTLSMQLTCRDSRQSFLGAGAEAVWQWSFLDIRLGPLWAILAA